MTRTADPPQGRALRCMEIWGGNSAVEEAVATPGLDVWVYSRPFEGAASGGDVQYMSLCGGGVITRLIVADVSGHGAAVAEFSATLRALLRTNINRKSQTRLVRALNRQFAERAQLRRFATAVVATYLATRKRLSVCNAGHPRPLWHRAAAGEWVVLTRQAGEPDDAAPNLPLGLDEETAYDQFAVPLGRGDVVLFYTDALIEAADPSGRLLGEEGLLGLARGLDPADPRGVGPALLAGVERHRGGKPADDDMTLLTLHHNAGGPRRMSLGEKLDVYAKVFGLKGV
jgi:sigma-B regulation protein RsbU (phosphoserine phosphatase)